MSLPTRIVILTVGIAIILAGAILGNAIFA